MTQPPVILHQRITWREGLTRKRRQAFEARTVGQYRNLWAGDSYAGYGKIETVLFARPGSIEDEVREASARFFPFYPRRVQVIVRVLSAKVDVRRVLGLDSSR